MQTPHAHSKVPVSKVICWFVDIYSAQCVIPLMHLWDHLSYAITQCYLPPDRGDSHVFTPGIFPVLIYRPWKGSWLCQDGLPRDSHPSKY